MICTFDLWNISSYSHQTWVPLDSGISWIGDDTTNTACVAWDFFNYGYATPDIFHSSVRKAVVCGRWKSMGKIWLGSAEIAGWALETPNILVFPKLLQELHLLCVIQAALRSPQSVMQSATSHPCHSHQHWNTRYLQNKGISRLAVCLAIRSQICKSGVPPDEYKQPRQTYMPLNSSIHPSIIPAQCHFVRRYPWTASNSTTGLSELHLVKPKH